MKGLIIAILTIISISSFGQIGRNEQPVDTIPIGGKTQEEAMDKNQGREDLTNQLTALRDSVNTIISDKANINRNINLSQRKKELDQMIRALKSSDTNENLLKQGETLLHDVRAELKGQ